MKSIMVVQKSTKFPEVWKGGKSARKSATPALTVSPYMLVIGQREADEGTISIRHRDQDDLGAKPLDEFIADAEVTENIRKRSLWKFSLPVAGLG